METFSALLALCAGNSSITGEFPSQRPVTRSFDIFFDLRLKKRLSKQSRRRWLETHRLHYDVTAMIMLIVYLRRKRSVVIFAALTAVSESAEIRCPGEKRMAVISIGLACHLHVIFNGILFGYPPLVLGYRSRFRYWFKLTRDHVVLQTVLMIF